MKSEERHRGGGGAAPCGCGPRAGRASVALKSRDAAGADRVRARRGGAARPCARPGSAVELPLTVSEGATIPQRAWERWDCAGC
jgi:hypothetical protein